MEDLRELGAELDRLAGTDPLGPINATALLERGRRGKRRRRLFAGGGAVAGIAAVAVAASLVPNLGNASKEPVVSKTGTPTVAPATVTALDRNFDSVPGVSRGEAAVGEKLTNAEANRRCKLRYPQIERTLMKADWYSGSTASYNRTAALPPLLCTIPGGDMPSADLVKIAKQDPQPSTEAAQLRNCSVLFWSDLSRWRVMASETAAGHSTTLLAISPSGRKVVSCNLGPELGDNAAALGSGPGIFPVELTERRPFDEHFLTSGGQVCRTGGCRGWLYQDSGRVASNIAKIRIEPVRGGKVHDVPVRDGWFAVSWINGDPQGTASAKLTAYDKAGKVLKTVSISG